MTGAATGPRWLWWAVPAAAALPFLPVLANGWLDWDDPENVLTNEHLGMRSADDLAWMLTAAHMGHWHPLTWLSHALDRALFGTAALGSHLTSLLLHALNALLVWRLLLRAVPASPAAVALGAMFFAVHPQRVESVAWATERRDVLWAAFVLLSALAYLRGAPRGRLWASLLAYSAACLAKAGAVAFPLVLLCLDVLVLRRPLRAWRPWLEKLPFAALGLLCAWQAARAQAAAGALVSYDAIPLLDRLRQAAYGSCWYARATLVPWPLLPIHERPDRLPLAEPGVLAACLVAAGASAAIALLARRRPWLAGGAVVYLAFLAPVLGFFQSGQQLVADRYTYLACLPFAAGCAALARHPRARAALAVWLLVLAGTTAWYTTRWRDTETLMRHAQSIDPDGNAANFFLGAARLRAAGAARAAGRPGDAKALAAEAERFFARALVRYPADAIAWTELGNARHAQGALQGAIEAWGRAVELLPDPQGNAALNLADLRRERPELFRAPR